MNTRTAGQEPYATEQDTALRARHTKQQSANKAIAKHHSGCDAHMVGYTDWISCQPQTWRLQVQALTLQGTTASCRQGYWGTLATGVYARLLCHTGNRCHAVYYMQLVVMTCRKWPAAPPWIEASPPGDAPAEWPVLLKKEVKVPLLPPKKPLLCCGDALHQCTAGNVTNRGQIMPRVLFNAACCKLWLVR